MLSGMLSSSNIGTSRENRGFTACAVKNNLRSGIQTDRKAQNLNCYFYLVDATLENKCMWRALQRCIKRNRPRKWVNLKQQGRSNRKREYATRHSWIFQMKRGKQNLERVHYHLRLCVFCFLFFSSSFKLNGYAEISHGFSYSYRVSNLSYQCTPLRSFRVPQNGDHLHRASGFDQWTSRSSTLLVLWTSKSSGNNFLLNKRCVLKHVSAKHNVYSQVFPSIK